LVDEVEELLEDDEEDDEDAEERERARFERMEVSMVFRRAVDKSRRVAPGWEKPVVQRNVGPRQRDERMSRRST
jgi:hypothetical protein